MTTKHKIWVKTTGMVLTLVAILGIASMYKLSLNLLFAMLCMAVWGSLCYLAGYHNLLRLNK